MRVEQWDDPGSDRPGAPPVHGDRIVFHLVIAMIHGLIRFWFAMAAALILYLRPPELPFRLPVPAWLRPRRAASVPLARENLPIP
jgi:hypothetical protein